MSLSDRVSALATRIGKEFQAIRKTLTESVTPDDLTIRRDESKELQAMDVAIEGDASDLASLRGQIGDVLSTQAEDQDLNELRESGNFNVKLSSESLWQTKHWPYAATNGLMVVSRVTDEANTVTQTFLPMAPNSNRIFRRVLTKTTVGDWVQMLTTQQIGDGLSVDNGVVSAPVYKGATSATNGEAGLVPPATSDDKDKVLGGDGQWKDKPVPDVYVGATADKAGVTGTVPPATSDERDKVLNGDGKWKDVPLPPNYIGASAAKSGVAGLVPPATSAQRNDVLHGNGSWGPAAADVPVFIGAQSDTQGKQGLVPAPQAMTEQMADQTYLGADAQWHTIEAQRGYIDYERRKRISSNRSTITVPEGTFVKVGDRVVVSYTDKVLSLDSVLDANSRKGQNLYLYACQSASGTEDGDFVISANSTVPSGYTAENSRKIGGFHCLCANVGNISGHALSGFVAGDILPASLWDLRHRAYSENEGMVYDEMLRLWVDIYLPSWNSSQNALVSTFLGNIISGTVPTNKALVGEDFVEWYAKVGKRLPWRHEFQVFSRNSNQQTNIVNSANPVTTGGHVDTANRRMISDIGVEDACGAYWQWASDTYEGGAYGTGTANQLWLNGYAWNLYAASVGDGKGQANGFLRRALLGGHWGYAASCGSRCVHCSHASAYVHGSISGRGVSEPRVWGAA